MSNGKEVLVQTWVSPELRERLRLAVELEGTTMKAVINDLLEGWVAARSSQVEAEARRRLSLIVDAEQVEADGSGGEPGG